MLKRNISWCVINTFDLNNIDIGLRNPGSVTKLFWFYLLHSDSESSVWVLFEGQGPLPVDHLEFLKAAFSVLFCSTSTGSNCSHYRKHHQQAHQSINQSDLWNDKVQQISDSFLQLKTLTAMLSSGAHAVLAPVCSLLCLQVSDQPAAADSGSSLDQQRPHQSSPQIYTMASCLLADCGFMKLTCCCVQTPQLVWDQICSQSRLNLEEQHWVLMIHKSETAALLLTAESDLKTSVCILLNSEWLTQILNCTVTVLPYLTLNLFIVSSVKQRRDSWTNEVHISSAGSAHPLQRCIPSIANTLS